MMSNTKASPSEAHIDKQLDDLLDPIFSYGIDWTEHRDKGGPNGDHDVSVFAGTIKGEMKVHLKNQLKLLLSSQLDSLEASLPKEQTDNKDYISIVEGQRWVAGYNQAISEVREIIKGMKGAK